MLTKTIGDYLHWSYANLAMAHAAVSAGDQAYEGKHFAIRSRLYKGLRSGAMKPGTFLDDERLKLILPQACCYCGSTEHLAVDHLFPRKSGGIDSGDNMVWACRRCNSSKGATDVLVWYEKRQLFPPLLLLRRYLKLCIELCAEKQVMDAPVDVQIQLPFVLTAVPHEFPKPTDLTLWVSMVP